MTTSTLAPPPPRMIPPLTPASTPFFTGGRQGQLLLLRETASRRWIHPFDDYQGEPPAAPEALSGKGEIYTYTVDHYQYNPAVPPPYVIALVQLPEQDDLRLFTNIVNVDFDKVHIGMAVKVTFEKQGDLFVPVFEPA